MVGKDAWGKTVLRETMNLEQLKDSLRPVTGTISAFEPMGNHELERHLVYTIICEGGVYALKLYLKSDRWNREVANLRRFAGTDVLAPGIVDYGVFENGVEWLVSDFVEGTLLSRIDVELPRRNLEAIYFEMGRQLGLIHQHKCDFFGSMDEHGESLHGFKSLKAYLLHSTSKILTDLHSVEHEDHVLIKRAESLFLTMLDSLEYNPPATLCHHDFGPRNILVSEQRGGYSLRSVIDFEHCVPSDRDEELIEVYLPLLERDPGLASSFRLGYGILDRIDPGDLLAKRDFYHLLRGLGICAWAKEVDYAYYTEGTRLLKEALSGRTD